MPGVAQYNAQFLSDVLKGLTGSPKWIPSRYFYDAKGDQLFRMIMSMPEYYLTRAEHEILKHQSRKILNRATGNKPVQLVELGAGDGWKTRLLLSELLDSKVKFEYYPIDISESSLQLLTANLEKEFHGRVPVFGIEGDYFEALDSPVLQRDEPRLILFLGSTIGNFQLREASDFMCRISQLMHPGDHLLVGFDLRKHPHTILAAYDDSQGITREFNLNLLKRINRELDADFNPDQFVHFAVYDPVQAAAKSYLVSQSDQEVLIGAAGQKLFFKAQEPILTEVSQKFDAMMIQEFASRNGLTIVESFTDSRGLFADVLFTKNDAAAISCDK